METNEIYTNSMEDILKNLTVRETSCEVLYNMGGQEVVKRDGKYFLEYPFDASFSKEITRETANELWDVYILGEKTKQRKIYE